MSAGAPGAGRPVLITAARVLAGPFTRRSWADLGYALTGLPLTLAGLVCVLVPLVLVLPPLTVASLPLLAVSTTGVRRLGTAARALASRLLGLAVTGPDTFRSEAGFSGWMRSALTDKPAWRARVYFIAKAPVELAGLATVVALRAGSLIFLASPAEWAAGLGTRQAVTGDITRRYVVSFGSFHFDTWPRMALAVIIGVAGWWLSPWALHGILRADKALITSLLGQPALSVRLRQLERSRSAAVEGAHARLRRIGRDLHDGAQAAGKLTGAAFSEQTEPARDVLADSLAAMGVDTGLHWAVLAERPAERFPNRWAGVTAEAIPAQMRPVGVRSVQVNRSGDNRQGCRPPTSKPYRRRAGPMASRQRKHAMPYSPWL